MKKADLAHIIKATPSALPIELGNRVLYYSYEEAWGITNNFGKWWGWLNNDTRSVV